MLSDSAFGPDVHYAGFTLVLDPRMSLKASAGSTRWPSAGALRWPGRKPSGPTASAKSSTALASLDDQRGQTRLTPQGGPAALSSVWHQLFIL
jgi:hypothetical protein